MRGAEGPAETHSGNAGRPDPARGMSDVAKLPEYNKSQFSKLHLKRALSFDFADSR
jgi:hypothetical protein